jgi:hypothetical protein
LRPFNQANSLNRKGKKVMNRKPVSILFTFMALLLAPLLSAGGIANHEPVQPGMAATTVAEISPQSTGTDFWLTFPGENPDPEVICLFITGDVGTTGTVTIPGLGFSDTFSVAAGAVTTVMLPLATELGDSSDTVGNKGVHMTAQDEVTVYGLNRMDYSTDAYLGLPTDILGTEYIVLAYENTIAPGFVGSGTQFAIVGTEDGTTVTLTLSVTTDGRTAGVPFSITLDQGQTYQLRNNGPSGNDLSGSIIMSDEPIAVFGSHRCPFIPSGFQFCDHIVEQLPPTVTWGKEFVTMPLATRLNGDTFRFLASTDGTNVSANGAVVATLNRGQFHEQIISAPAHISSDQPILVAQYSNSTTYDGVTSDPFMMLIPPFEQFLGNYTVTTPASGIAINFINVVAPDAAVGAITLDGTAIPATSFLPIGSSGFSGAQLSVAIGSHNLSGPLPFGVFVYGFDEADSYGYPGGMSLAPVVTVTNVELTPETATNPVDTEHCVVATVTDQDDDVVEGVRVDFEVTGVNTAAGFALTDADGQAQSCYTGTNPGTDAIEASVGTIADTATKTWLDETADLDGHKFDDLAGDGPGGTDLPLGGIEILLLEHGSGSVVDQAITNADGSYAFNDVSPGEYLICEDLSSMPGRIQTFPTTGENHPQFGVCYRLIVAPSQDISGLDFYNHRSGSITIVKDAMPDDPQDFDFTSSDPSIGNFSLDDDSDPSLPNGITFTGLLAGSYRFTETVPVGWVLSEIRCDNGLLLPNPSPPAYRHRSDLLHRRGGRRPCHPDLGDGQRNRQRGLYPLAKRGGRWRVRQAQRHLDPGPGQR